MATKPTTEKNGIATKADIAQLMADLNSKIDATQTAINQLIYMMIGIYTSAFAVALILTLNHLN